MNKVRRWWRRGWPLGLLMLAGCTVKAVGDPNRPITINAHVTIDIKGLEQTASSIEDYVSGAGSGEVLSGKSGAGDS